jgi:hypothetical protein
MNRNLISYIGLSTSLSALPLVAEAPLRISTTAEIGFTEVSRKVVNLGDHTMSFIRVRTPVLPSAPRLLPVAPSTAAEFARVGEPEKKGFATLNVSATVFLDDKRTITELRWWDETGANEYIAYSNADFRYLDQLSQIETEKTVYMWFPFVNVFDLTNLGADSISALPSGVKLSTKETEYVVDVRAKNLASEEITLAGLDYLHAFYQLHASSLKADYKKRMTDNAAREKELREHPPVKPDTVIHFWPIKSGVKSR